MANIDEAEIREEVSNVNNEDDDGGNYVVIAAGDGTENFEYNTISNKDEQLIALTSNENGGEDEEAIKSNHFDFKKRGKYTKYSKEDKIEIGKIAAERGNAFAQRKYQYSKYPSLSESTVRSFKALYQKEQLLIKKSSKPEKKVRGKYQTYNETTRFTIGKFAHETGNANALRQFKSEFPGLSESTVRGFKMAYMREMVKMSLTQCITPCNDDNQDHQSSAADEKTTSEVISLQRKKRGRPMKVPDNLEATIARYLQAIAEKEEKPLSYKTVIGITKGVIIAENRFLLTEFGGGLDIDKSWAQSFTRRCNINRQKTDHPSNQCDNDFIQKMERFEQENTESHNEDENNDIDEQENFVVANCNIGATPSMVMIVNDETGEKNKIIKIGATLEELPVLTSIASGEQSSSDGIINIKITDAGQSFITTI